MIMQLFTWGVVSSLHVAPELRCDFHCGIVTIFKLPYNNECLQN